MVGYRGPDAVMKVHAESVRPPKCEVQSCHSDADVAFAVLDVLHILCREHCRELWPEILPAPPRPRWFITRGFPWLRASAREQAGHVAAAGSSSRSAP
jgi:hypothetical protein